MNLVLVSGNQDSYSSQYGQEVKEVSQMNEVQYHEPVYSTKSKPKVVVSQKKLLKDTLLAPLAAGKYYI